MLKTSFKEFATIILKSGDRGVIILKTTDNSKITLKTGGKSQA
jgi:hypothetical protein